MFNGISLKEVAEKYYLIPKGVKYSENNEDTTELAKAKFEILDMFKCYSDEELKNIYIVKRKTEKKLSDEEVKKIKEFKGSVREKAKRFGVSVGTISKINNDKY
ncbi:hypothetical protein H8J86_15985 [Clostridium perfringens]|uniref:hypothetical protein n=1 Tax=Clostridium perfringens TaxID=1502 RepID=UPI0018E42782|nr:hypothetical protein [Clostridium perfringens]MBI6007434.1 hypothetical protein [Clostridium perfringens]